MLVIFAVVYAVAATYLQFRAGSQVSAKTKQRLQVQELTQRRVQAHLEAEIPEKGTRAVAAGGYPALYDLHLTDCKIGPQRMSTG